MLHVIGGAFDRIYLRAVDRIFRNQSPEDHTKFEVHMNICIGIKYLKSAMKNIYAAGSIDLGDALSCGIFQGGADICACDACDLEIHDEFIREQMYYLLDTWKKAHSYLKYKYYCPQYERAARQFLPLRIELAAMTQIILGRWLLKPMGFKFHEIEPLLSELSALVPPETAHQLSAEFCEDSHLLRKEQRRAGARGGGVGGTPQERQQKFVICVCSRIQCRFASPMLTPPSSPPPRSHFPTRRNMVSTMVLPILRRELLARFMRSRQPSVKVAKAMALQVKFIAAEVAASDGRDSRATKVSSSADSAASVHGAPALSPSDLLRADSAPDFVPTEEEIAAMQEEASASAPARKIKENRPESKHALVQTVAVAGTVLFQRVRGSKKVSGRGVTATWQCKSDIVYFSEVTTKDAKAKKDGSTRVLQVSSLYGTIAGVNVERDDGGCWITLSLLFSPKLSQSHYEMVAPKSGGKAKKQIKYGQVDILTAVNAAAAALDSEERHDAMEVSQGSDAVAAEESSGASAATANAAAVDVDAAAEGADAVAAVDPAAARAKQLRHVSLRFDNVKGGALHKNVDAFIKDLSEYLLA